MLSGSQDGYVAAKLRKLFSILPCRLRAACMQEHCLSSIMHTKPALHIGLLVLLLQHVT